MGDRVTQRIRVQAASAGSGVQIPPGLWLTAPGARQSAASGPNSLKATPLEIGIETWVSALGINVTGAGNSARIGIYADSGRGQPGALLQEVGTVSTTTTGVKTVTAGLVLTPGLWWLAVVCQNGTSTLSCYSGALRPVAHASLDQVAATGMNSYENFSVTGPLPATFTISTCGSTGPVVGLLTS